MDALVEQKQEKQRGVGRRLAVLVSAASCVVILAAGSCKSGSTVHSAPAPAIQSPLRQAWVGGLKQGPYVLVEELSQPPHVRRSLGGEEAMFRHTFGLEESTQLLRVHVFQVRGEGDFRGSVDAGTAVFTKMPPAREEWDARARLYWQTMTTGAQSLAMEEHSATHLIYLVAAEHAPRPNPEQALHWQLGSLRIALQPLRWTEPQRRAFLDDPASFDDE